MKYKKEIRWLAFLLIPFIILLTLHFVIPLSFVLQSYPLLKDALLQQTIHVNLASARSFTLASSKNANNLFSTFTNQQRIFMNMLLKNGSNYMKVNHESTVMNNAYQFATNINQKSLNLNTTAYQAMWFSTGLNQTRQLSPTLSSALQQYTDIDPFLKTFLLGSIGSLIFNLNFYIVNNNSQSLCIQYPSRFSQKFSNLNSNCLDTLYYDTVTFSQGKIIPFLDYSLTCNLSLLAFCISASSGTLSVVSCLRLNLPSLGSQLSDLQFYNGGGNTTNFQSYIALSNNIDNNNLSDPLLALYFNIQGSPHYLTPENQSISLNSANIPAQIFSSISNSLNNNLFINVKNFTTYFTAPITATELNSTNIGLHLISKQIANEITATDGIIQNLVRSLLIPIISLIVLASILSVCIINCLLNSVDNELYELDSLCKFIADGDINIEIPYHEGTKDIKHVYEQVKTINKLHRYSTQKYFTGHFTEKIFKYNEAIQYLKKLGYDTGNLLQNIGETYTYIEQWDKARQNLKESVHLILKRIESQFGTIDSMLPKKYRYQTPRRYRQLQLILIRRLFKLNFFHFRYLELKTIFQKKQTCEQDKILFEKKQKEIAEQCTKYTDLLKKAFAPDYSYYSECIICMFNEFKQLATLKKVEEASKLIENVQKCFDKYAYNYDKVTRELKEKGSKQKFLHMKNKLTAHSRVHPDILKTCINLFKSKIVQLQPKTIHTPNKYLQIFNWLFNGTKVGTFTAAVCYINIGQIRKVLKQFKIDLHKFQCTQICRQSMPFKTLFYGQITKENEAELLRIPTKASQGLEREYVLIFDCGKDNNLAKSKQAIKTNKQKMSYLFQKLIKKTDRISIMKHSSKLGIKIDCNLILKQYNQAVIKKTIDDALEERNPNKNKEIQMVEVLNRAIWRIKHLKLEKVIVMFFKSIEEYQQQLRKMIKKRKTKYQYNKRKETFVSEQDESNLSIESHEFFGSCVVQLMQQEGLRNLKLIFYCSPTDPIEKFREYFDLQDINRRIWSHTGGLNIHNNIVYVIEDSHKSDIDRILMLKTQDIPDNNVFVL